MRARGRRRRRRVVLTVVAVAAAAVVGWLSWNRSSARQVSQREALARFHPLRSATGGPVRPAQGVYTYTGTGHESISIPPKSQAQGPEMPGTVTWRPDGCWVLRIDFSTNHWETWIYCPRPEGMVELGGQSFQRWPLVVTDVTNTSTFTCDPPAVTIRPAMRAGDRWQQSCRGTSTATKGDAVSAGTYSFVGSDVVVVGSVRVPAFHFVQDRTLSGAQRGTQRADMWFRAPDGLPLRNERSVHVKTDSVVGTVTYTETGSFTLARATTARAGERTRSQAAWDARPGARRDGARSGRSPLSCGHRHPVSWRRPRRWRRGGDVVTCTRGAGTWD